MLLPRLLLVAAAVTIGTLGLLGFGLHLWGAVPWRVSLGLSDDVALAWNAALSLAFFAQHSGMVRASIRRRVTWLVSERHFGVVYAIASGLGLLGLVLLWQPSDTLLYTAGGLGRGVLRGCFLAAGLGMVWGVRALGGFDLFGVSSLSEPTPATPAPGPAPELQSRGPYRWVRHPLYSLALVMIWSCPDGSLDRCLFNGVWTIWVVVGTRLEERDLVDQFGDAYRAYQRSVPMLIPRRPGKLTN